MRAKIQDREKRIGELQRIQDEKAGAVKVFYHHVTTHTPVLRMRLHYKKGAHRRNTPV